MLWNLKALGAGFTFAPDDSGGGGSSSAGKAPDAQTEATQKDASQDEKSGSVTTSSENGDQSKTGSQDDKPPSLDDLPEYWRTHIKDLRDENKNRRKEVDDIKKDSQRQKDAALAEQGNFKQLYEDLKPKHEALEVKAAQFDRYQEAFKTLYDNAIKNVPQHIQSLLADRDPLDALTWIQENQDSLNQPQKEDLDAGKKGSGKENAYVGSEEHKKKLRQRIHIP